MLKTAVLIIIFVQTVILWLKNSWFKKNIFYLKYTCFCNISTDTFYQFNIYIYFFFYLLIFVLSRLSLNAGQIMLVHYHQPHVSLLVRSLFPSPCDVSLLWCGVKETADSWSGRREKPREVEPAAQSQSLSATGFSFPLPLLSVCFVSSFVLLCLDSERVHAARHVIAHLQVSGNQGLFSSQLLYPIQDVYSYSKRNYSSPSTEP